MAMVACKECGKKISTKAKACPECGAERPKKTSGFTWFVLIAIIFGVYVANQTPKPPSTPLPAPPAPPKPLTAEEKAAEAERVRLAELNNTGIWKIGSFVNEFGDSTGDKYIGARIEGTFSNTATQDSDLIVSFLISSEDDIAFKLYEYARNNPVKSPGSVDEYQVLIQGADDLFLRLKAENYSDRLGMTSNHSRSLHSALMKGGTIQFVVTEVDRPTSKYKFTIPNADHFDNAVRILGQ